MQDTFGGKFMLKTIKIEGMSCGHCENRVKNALSAVNGIKIIRVSAADDVAEIEFENESHLQEAIAAIEDAGYDVIQ